MARATSFSRVLAGAAVVLVLGVAVWLRAWRLDCVPALNGDEAWYGALACDALAGREVPLRTPTGNLLNLFFLGPQVVVHALCDPSPAAVRFTALASGLLALAVNFLLARHTLDFTAAVASTLLLAVLPTNIAYSRFGWDASQTLLFSVLVCHASLRLAAPGASWRWGAAWCGLALGAACWVHPTNVFLVALPGAAMVARWRQNWFNGPGVSGTAGRASSGTHTSRCPGHFWTSQQWHAFVLVAGAMLIVGVGALLASERLRERAVVAARRSVVVEQYPLFARNVLRLFSGLSVYRYIPGSQLPADDRVANSWRDVSSYDLAGVAALFACVVAWRGATRRGVAVSREDRVLLWGYGGTLLLFFWLAGPEAIEPHYERYGLCLIAPATLLCTRCLGRTASAWPGARGVGFALLMAGGGVWLGDFHHNYFQHIAATGGTSHATFRTGDADPKWLAVRQAMAGASAEAPTTIVASEWWNYWPARYYASKTPGVRVLWQQELADASLLVEPLPSDRHGAGATVWLLEFADSAALRQHRVCLAREHIAFDEWQYGDATGQPVVSLLQLRPAAIEAPPSTVELSGSNP